MLTNLFGIVMKAFYNMFNNYGIAILVFTLFSKIILFPVSLIVQKNSVKFLSIKPQLNKIKIDNYGDDNRITELESKLYKKEKYNPFFSAIPLILQIVILVILINIVTNPITYISNIDQGEREALINQVDNSKYKELKIIKEVKNENIKNKELQQLDLSFINYDLSDISIDTHNYLFPFIAALSTLVYCLISMKYNVLQKEESLFYNLVTTILSVLLSVYLGLYVPYGIALYWIFSNILAILQLFLLNAIINPKKYVDYKELELTKKKLKELSIDNRSRSIKQKEKADYKRFFSIDNKHFVIYGENKSYYRYFKGIINYLLKNSNIIIHYITSDIYDDAFKIDSDRFKCYYIGKAKLISLMMKMDSDIVLMTTPDLDNYHLKKSLIKKDIEYIFLPHGIGNHNVFGRKGSLDNFDTIFALDKYQKKEIEAGNKVYNLNRKVVELGYPMLDEMINNYKPKKISKRIIIAPSWQKDNIMDLCIDNIIDILTKKYDVIIRPHPQYLKYNKDKLLKYNGRKHIKIQDDYTDLSNIFDSEILITDWSAIAYEYAYTTKKSVIFINTPMKVLNKDYKKLNIDIFELKTRDIIGKSINLDELEDLEKTVEYLINNKQKYSKRITRLYKNNVYNPGNSSEVAAKYIASSIKEKISRRKHD